MDNCPLDEFCVCGHAWWAHHPEYWTPCIARGCDCATPPPVECTCGDTA